jgi:phosphate transport system permease protein
MVAKENFFSGVLRSKRQGFDFGGKLNLTHNLVPDQGSSLRHLSSFLVEPPQTDPNEAGIGPALAGTIWVCAGCALFALPLGIGTAICLEEFRPKNRWLRFLHNLVQLNITNLAGVPSIVYGIVGLTAFATMFGLFGSPKNPMFEIGAKHYFQYISEGNRVLRIPAVRGGGPGSVDENWVEPELVDGMDVWLGDKRVPLHLAASTDALPDDNAMLARTLVAGAEGGPAVDRAWYYVQLPLGRSVLAASLTLMLVILPVIIIATQEALRAVPSTLREGSLGLGSTRWQMVRNVTFPAAVPGIMTGAILSMSRAIGEAAPIIVLAGIVYISSGPQHLVDLCSVLPVQIYYWAGLPVDQLAEVNWQNVAACGIVVLLAILLTFNAIAITIRLITFRPLS